MAAQKQPDAESPQAPAADPSVINVALQDFTQAITNAVSAGRPKRVLFHEYKPVTPFNPRGLRNRELPYRVYQNGSLMHTDTLTDREIELLGQLKTGRFIEGLVSVYAVSQGGETDWHIDYSNQSIEQRMNFKNHVRNLTDLLEQVVNGPAMVTR